MKRGLSSCSCSRNLRRVFSQTQTLEKNREAGLAEMVPFRNEKEIESSVPFPSFHLRGWKMIRAERVCGGADGLATPELGSVFT